MSIFIPSVLPADHPGEELPVMGSVQPPRWHDRPVIIVGTGPSLKGFDFERLRGLGWILACKESMFSLPFADAIFGLDIPWMRQRHDYLAERVKSCEVYLAVPHQRLLHFRNIPGVQYLRRLRTSNTFIMDPTAVEAGGNSGFGAINLAVIKGARKIFLFGFDYSAGHFNQERYDERDAWGNGYMNYFPRWATHFDETVDQLNRLRVEIVNASPDSNVKAYERTTHDDAIDRLGALAGKSGRGV